MKKNKGRFNIKSDHLEAGEAIDQEKVIELRPQIEDYVRENVGKYERTELYWDMNEKGNFYFEIHFFTKQN